MCEQAIEIELKKIFMEQDCFKEEYIFTLKENFLENKKQLKRLILADFMNNIKNNKSLALFDEDIFNIYKNIIDNYKLFLNKTETLQFKFNDKILKNLNGIISVLKSQVTFFLEDNYKDINPVYIEKKSIINEYIDNIYKAIDNLFEDDFNQIDIKNIKQYVIDLIVEKIIFSYKTNLIECFNAINDIENRKKVNYFNEILEEEQEILTSIVKHQIKALEDLCENDDEKNKIENILKPIIEGYQQDSKKFNNLNQEIKAIDTNVNINFEKDDLNIKNLVLDIFKNVAEPKDKFKDKIIKSFDKYISLVKEQIILNKKEEINLTKEKIEKSLTFSKSITDIFYNLTLYIKENNDFYVENSFFNIIDGIYESIDIKVCNIKEKEEEILLEKEEVYNNIGDILNKIENTPIKYNFDNIYDLLKEDFKIDSLIQELNIKDILSNLDKAFMLYIKKIEDFIKNTILFEISTFQEIIYYSVVRLRECEEENIKELVSYIDDTENNIEKELINNDILLIKPKPYDMFNVKEHEVLIAEKNDEFLKGQIIKVINYGYKIKDKEVIKRATIIAAK